MTRQAEGKWIQQKGKWQPLIHKITECVGHPSLMIYNSVGAAEDGIFLWGRAFHSFTKRHGKLQRSHLHKHTQTCLHSCTYTHIKECKPTQNHAHLYPFLYTCTCSLFLSFRSFTAVCCAHCLPLMVHSEHEHPESASLDTAAEYSALRSLLLPLSLTISVFSHLKFSLFSPLPLQSYSTSGSISPCLPLYLSTALPPPPPPPLLSVLHFH